jgi:hypothetical protein
MSQDDSRDNHGQDFLRRWSRRKLDAKSAATAPQVPATPAPEALAEPAPQLPSVDSLTFESDFKVFMHSKVEQGVKRAALKKLFSDPRFNVMDGLDTYIDDYSIENPIPDEMLARLDHARQALFGQPKDEEKTRQEATQEQAETLEQHLETREQQEKAAETARIETNGNVDPAQDPKAL